jgi:hypothetical protein
MSNLEITKFNINYVKQKSIDLESLEKDYNYNPEDLEYNYNPFQLKSLQNYNPIYSLFFELTEKNYNKIALNHEYHFVNMNKVIHYETKDCLQKPVFIKYSPLIDPIRYMTGKYKDDMDKLNILPNPFSSEITLQKISYYNNTSYTDNFFSFLASKLMHKHKFIHGVDFYGSFLCVQEKFKVNISDDLEYLNLSEYFEENINKIFTVSIDSTNEFTNFGSRSNKKKIQIEDNSDDVSIDDLDIITSGENLEVVYSSESNELVYEKENNVTASTSSDSSNNSKTNYSDNDSVSDNNSDNDNDTDSDESASDESVSDHSESDESDNYNDDDDEENKYAFINDYPVQMICLEKCDGTMDELFVKDIFNKETGAAALMQIIMILIAYQKAFHFTHNDLHTNNIMYINTDIKYLFYRYDKKIYRVPTYGKIFKIIDFGRSAYIFEGQLFFSDSFAPGGDGATQYNCEPFMNDKKPRIDPNYSFDLCRLGCSIYDFIIDDDKNPEEFDELQKTIYRWCLDDNDKNILYKRNGEERYPNFKLYKMIARSVHNHTPQEQLNFSLFKQFLHKKSVGEIMDIDDLPSYV